MEKFKAVEKAMKTKAYSKEGLSAAAKLDPKERAKMEACDFLGNMVDELERQIETNEAEAESLQATMRKGKNQTAKAERIAEIERVTERHKWHQGKLELIKRSLENGGVETEQVNELEESIKYYVQENATPEFMEDDEMYDELNLQEEEDTYGMGLDNDRVSSQDTQSIQEESPEESRSSSLPGKSKSTTVSEGPAAARRPSTQMKSPLPTLATLHNPSPSTSNSASQMKPAAVPPRVEGLKYASAAAAAAASDKNNLGIAPLPPPPEALPAAATSSSHPPLPSNPGRKSTAASPVVNHALPDPSSQTNSSRPTVPTVTSTSDTSSSSKAKSPSWGEEPSLATTSNVPQPPLPEKAEPSRPRPSRFSSQVAPNVSESGASRKGKSPMVNDVEIDVSKSTPVQSNGVPNGVRPIVAEEDESVYHLPASLQDLLQAFEATHQNVKSTPSQSSQASQRMLAASFNTSPDMLDVGTPRNYRPEIRCHTPAYYPQELDPVFDDHRLYSRIDPDTLFYVFYYKQATYQQYLAARALKDQSWRFHKQYQTWFQRHEEPKTITEEFEQGTYRFFDYESTWFVAFQHDLTINIQLTKSLG
jgi:CCR4-NOT transcription complex subunit 3